MKIVIKDKILSLGYNNYVAEISSIDAQELLNGSFLVLVSGCFKGSDNWSLRYSKLLFLTPQIRGNYKGYCVLTDVFRFVVVPSIKMGTKERRKRNWRSLPIKFLMLWRASPIMVNGCPVIVEEKRSGYQGKGTMGDGFHLEQGMGTEMREQEGQQTLEAEVMVGVILLAEQIVEIGEGNLGRFWNCGGDGGNGGLTRWEAMVGHMFEDL
ncbi:hypothetical protein Tsubulata_045630 [Turnera subulata]|uniref:NTF2 domain-containing protein n=1 Tax=Turnera subulata TaxID=218843 RepID=A0A9Q0F3V6_9ROSI|nr:hypothetical protein Tsubulata_045630 [Turnera subulata]